MVCRSSGVALALLFVLALRMAAPPRASADEASPPEARPPEALLAAESVGYVRFDGFAPEREAYQKTILAGLLRDQFGPLIDDLSRRITDALGPQALGERLLEGAEPDQLLKVQVALKELPHLWEYLDRHGFAMGVEVVDPTADVPKFQITFVFPQGAEPEHRAALFGGFRLLGLASETPVVELEQSGRSTIGFEQPGDVRVAAWQEGEHVVLIVGTLDFDHTVALADGKRESLLANPAYEKLQAFDAYPTLKRGFVDVDGIAELALKAMPPLADVFEQLGLRDLKNVRFHVGFEDRLVRTTFVLDTPGERRGLLQILSPGGEIDPAQLPPLPPDSAAVMASTIDLGGTYDAILDAIDGSLKIFAPLAKNTIQGGLDEMKRVLGVDLRQDVLAALGSPIVVFNSPGDGPLNLGMGIAIKVRDPERLERSLETIVRSLGSFTDARLEVTTRELHGGRMHMIVARTNEFPFKPTYTVHEGWLVIGLLPAPVQGFLYRSQDETAGGAPPARWELPAPAKAAIDEALAEEGARMTGLYVTDPRPTAEAVLAISPFLVQMISTFSGAESDFDISLIPNAQSVTEPLHENVTVVIDDGKSIRYEGYATLPMPIQLTGLESYAYLAAFAFLGFAF